jgi:hypothetical protein
MSAIITSVRQIIPDPDALVRTIAAFSTSSDSSIHGEQHWQTVGVCWDADRLHLWRIAVTPDPSRLSTAAGRARIGWARIERYRWRAWDPVWVLAGADDRASMA